MILMIFPGRPMYAQQAAIDSLEQRLVKLDASADRVDVLCSLSDRYLAFQPEKAEAFAREALELARQLDYTKGQALALNRLGEYEFRQSNYAIAIQTTMQSLQLAEKLKDSTLMEFAYRVLGNINTAGLNRYDTALRYHMKAFAIQKRQHNPARIAASCGSISWIYAMTNSRIDEGLRLANRGIRLADSLHHPQFLAYNYNSKGLLFKQQAQYDSALHYLNLSNRAAEIAKDRTVIAYNQSIIGEILVMQGELQEALHVLRDALSRSREVNNREVVKNAFLWMADAYGKLGDFANAYRYHTLHSQLKDSLLSVRIAERATVVRFEFLKEKQMAKIEELEVMNAKERKEKFLLGVLFLCAILFMIAIIVLIFRNSRDRKTSNEILKSKNEEIAERNRQLQEAGETKDKIFSIIGHDLRGPTGRLKAMIEMLTKGILKEGEFKSHLPKIAQQVAGISNTLENLLLWSRNHQLKGSFQDLSVKSLISNCVALLESSAQEKNITLETCVPDAIAVQGIENEITLVFRNLISNAIKFTPEGGRIRINGVLEGGRVRITIADNGVGMSPDQVAGLFLPTTRSTRQGTQGETGTGLGLMFAKEVIDQYSGTIEVQSQLHKGSCFTVTLPAGQSALT